MNRRKWCYVFRYIKRYAFLDLELEVVLQLGKTTKLIGKIIISFGLFGMFEIVRWRRERRVGVKDCRLLRKKQQILWDGLSIYHRTLSYPRKCYAVSSIKQPSIIVIRSLPEFRALKVRKLKKTRLSYSMRTSLYS